MLVLQILLLALGFVLLVKGADWFVDGASGIADKLGIPQLVIGLTIVAMGTSAPEAAVSITAGLNGSNAIALGNVVGSNIFNLLFILGAASALTSINVAAELFIDTAILIGVTVMMYLICRSKEKTTRTEGAICVLAYAAYMAYIIIR